VSGCSPESRAYISVRSWTDWPARLSGIGPWLSSRGFRGLTGIGFESSGVGLHIIIKYYATLVVQPFGSHLKFTDGKIQILKTMFVWFSQ